MSTQVESNIEEIEEIISTSIESKDKKRQTLKTIKKEGHTKVPWIDN